MENCKIIFTDFLEDYSFSITLVSHYTTIIGFDSGEGKTWMFDSVSRKQAAGELQIDCDYNVIFSTLESLDLEERTVIITDEFTISKSQSIINKINNCKHLILAITRTSLKRANSPLDGIYKIILTDDSVFSIQPINYESFLPLTRELSNVDIILTEAYESKSEHQFLSNLCELTGNKLKVIAAGGKDNIAKKLRYFSKEEPNANILVFMDLGNVSSQFKFLEKQCRKNSNIKFFDYVCFEELLSESKLFEKLKVIFNESVFDFLTPEKYYEKKLEIITKNTKYAYDHKKPILSACYLIYCLSCVDSCELYNDRKFYELLDSEIGKSIYHYFFESAVAKNHSYMSVNSDNEKKPVDIHWH